jgi:hypothetical protein
MRGSDARRAFSVATSSRQRYRAGHVAHHLGPNPALKRTGRYVPSLSVAVNAAGRLASSLGANRVESLLPILLVAPFVALNIWATRRVVLDGLLSRSQAIAHVVFIWLVPILGALFSGRLLSTKVEKSSGRYPSEREPLEDFGTSGASLRHRARSNEPSSDPAEGHHE